MKSTLLSLRSIKTSFSQAVLILCCVALFAPAVVRAETWSGIEPLKSTRADVERSLAKSGQPTSGPGGSVRYKVPGGTVTIYFVDPKFVATKKLDPSVEGTVLEIVLQHDNSNDTPQTLGLADKKDFEKEDTQVGTIYRNLKDGIVYTFVQGKLKTTRYTASQEQLAKARK
jgi:hypothetical protein